MPPATIGNRAEIAYWVDGTAGRVRLEIRDKDRVIVSLPTSRVRGVYRVSWDLRMIPAGVDEREAREEGARLPLPFVLPGAYTAALVADTREQSQPIDVREDPRLELTAPQRAAWTAAQVRLWRVVMHAEEKRTTAIGLREQAGMLAGAEMVADAARLRVAAHDLEEIGERAEKLLKAIAGRAAPISPGDLRRIDSWEASVTRLETKIAAIQQNMRSKAAKPR